jgi:hypothetical protein
MSELAKSSREAMRAKAKRLTSGEPHTKVDSSTWSPPEMENAGIKTGARPLSKRQYKSGGKVHGADAKKRADRAKRKSGGRTESADRSKRFLTPDNLINRDVRMANEEREGIKHVGAFKKGGRIHKDDGGQVDPIAQAIRQDEIQNAMKGRGIPARVPLPPRRPVAVVPRPREVIPVGSSPTMKRGGKAAMHEDVAEDKKLIKKMVKPSAMKRDEHCWGGETKQKKADGGKIKWIQGAIKHPGSLHKALKVPEGEKIPAKKLEKATHSKNPKLAKKAHLAETLKRMHHAKGGEVFSGNSVTKIPGEVPGGRNAHKHGGKAKGKTHININVNAHPAGGMPMAGGPMGGPPIPPMPPMAPPPGNQPNPAMLAALAGGMGGGMGGARPPMAPPMAPMTGGMPMARKSGGRTMGKPEHVIDHAAGGGLGRLEKIKAYGHKA